MKALRKIGMLLAAVAITAIGIGCQNTVEVEKEKTYVSAVTFKAEDVGEAGVKITMITASCTLQKYPSYSRSVSSTASASSNVSHLMLLL